VTKSFHIQKSELSLILFEVELTCKYNTNAFHNSNMYHITTTIAVEADDYNKYYKLKYFCSAPTHIETHYMMR
jgi:hypothetical protein